MSPERESRWQRFRRAPGAAVIAVLLFASGIVANLLSNDLEARFGTFAGYTQWLYAAACISLLLAVMLAIRDQRAAPAGDYPTVVSVSQPANEQERRDRRTMIARQRSIWIDGVLKQSLWNDALIDLGLAERPDAVPQPYRYRIASRAPGQEDRLLPAGTHVINVYDQHQGALLILGAPGSGKTTLMLELMRDLLDRADEDETHPIPVKFDLSAWGADRPPIDAWLATQLNTQYGVSRQAAATWVKRGMILPLLDGLDEVAAERRAACAAAINAYRQERGLWPLVVCCREREYTELGDILRLHGAVVVQPLTDEQVQAYLDRGGERLAGVRRLIADDPALLAEDAASGRLLATPLMLNIVTSAYADAPDVQVHGTTVEQRRAMVFDRYVTRAITREDKPADRRFTPDSTLHRLRWLAWRLHRNSRSTYQMEEMQPDWLDRRGERRFTTIISELVFGLVSIVGGLVFGVVFGLVFGVVFGVVGGLFWGLDVGLGWGLGWGLGGGLFLGPISSLIIGQLFRILNYNAIQFIRAIDRLTWSWQGVWKGMPRALLWGLVGGIVPVLVVGQHVGLFGMLVSGLVFGLVVGLIAGFSRISLSDRIQPNAGIHASLRNGLFWGLVWGLVWGLGIGTGIGLGIEINSGLVAGLLVGLIGGLFVGWSFGLNAALQHYTLRLLLAWRGLLPLNIIAFCDYCAQRALLQRVGGGWQFVHRLLLDHLADQYEAELSDAHVMSAADTR